MPRTIQEIDASIMEKLKNGGNPEELLDEEELNRHREMEKAREKLGKIFIKSSEFKSR